MCHVVAYTHHPAGRVMVSKLKTAGVSNIIMLAPPPVDDVYHFKVRDRNCVPI